MDLLDRLLGHDSWTTRQLLERAGGLSDEYTVAKFSQQDAPDRLKKIGDEGWELVALDRVDWRWLVAGRRYRGLH